MKLDKNSGLIDQVRFIPSPNHDERDPGCIPEVIIIHCISLPPGDYTKADTGDDCVTRFFCNKLDAEEDDSFKEIAHLEVSAHFYIQRDGSLTQFVPTHLRAWHAGESVCLGRPKVNNFSIGIELQGLDTDPEGFTDEQYRTLTELVTCIRNEYPEILATNIFGHHDIAPGRKTDPGAYFDWGRFLEAC